MIEVRNSFTDKDIIGSATVALRDYKKDIDILRQDINILE